MSKDVFYNAVLEGVWFTSERGGETAKVPSLCWEDAGLEEAQARAAYLFSQASRSQNKVRGDRRRKRKTRRRRTGKGKGGEEREWGG